LDETSCVVVHEWAPNLNIGLEIFNFQIVGISNMMHYFCPETTLYVFMTCALFQYTMNNVQMQCSQVAKVNDRLEKWFPTHDVMDVSTVVYLQYWLKSTCESSFPTHMDVLKKFYYQFKKLGSSQTWIPLDLNANILDLQTSFFKLTLMSNVQWAMDQPMDLNPIFRLWKKFTSNALLCVQFSKFM